MENYARLDKIGEGTYGVVYKAKQASTDRIVAMKRIRLDEDLGAEGVPSTAVREVAVLRELCMMADESAARGVQDGGANIVQLLDVIHAEARLSLIFEFCDNDLKRYMDNVGQRKLDALQKSHAPGKAPVLDRHSQYKARALPQDEVRKLLRQLLLGLLFLHSKRIMHRDLKPQNLLIDSEGQLKIADFGLARAFGVPLRTYTHEIITLWYRPPEVLLGGRHYATSVDIWSVGCIFAEMATGMPLVAGDSEIGQLFKIFQLFGTPTEEQWPGLRSLPDWKPVFPHWKANKLGEDVPTLDKHGIDLLQRMMVYEPLQRISAKGALVHPYFQPTRITIPTVSVSCNTDAAEAAGDMEYSPAPSLSTRGESGQPQPIKFRGPASARSSPSSSRSPSASSPMHPTQQGLMASPI